jgi:uncharacterized protein YecE (DUF72 family)
MRVYVGTSGWQYDWNEGQSLDWYLKNSGLNSIELNASFYRFPFPNQVKSWAEKTESLKDFRWSIKVNRLVTHVFKFSEKAFRTWKKFERLFEPLRNSIDFFLFQLPPILTPKSAERIVAFYKKTKLEEKFAIEWRNINWFDKSWVKWAENLGLTLVSVDAPDFEKFPREIYCTNGIVYLRMHGRTTWYSHYYTNSELEEVKEKILKAEAWKVYVYFNNNHNMLENAQRMKKLLEGKSSEENRIEKLRSGFVSNLKRFVFSRI